jgi:hypothetical protein
MREKMVCSAVAAHTLLESLNQLTASAVGSRLRDLWTIQFRNLIDRNGRMCDHRTIVVISNQH